MTAPPLEGSDDDGDPSTNRDDQSGPVDTLDEFSPVDHRQARGRQSDRSTSGRWRDPKYRFIASVLIIGHLWAVFGPPLDFQTRGALGASSFVDATLKPLRNYSQTIYTDRGYAFFGPDPGPSNLIQVRTADGEEFFIPNHDRYWPRLRYHRHFMLSEFFASIYQPPPPVFGVEQAAQMNRREGGEAVRLRREVIARWTHDRRRYEAARSSMVRHLKNVTGGDVSIRRVRHRLPDWVAFAEQPIPLSDQRLYEVMFDEPPPVAGSPALGSPALGSPESTGSDAMGSDRVGSDGVLPPDGGRSGETIPPPSPEAGTVPR